MAVSKLQFKEKLQFHEKYFKVIKWYPQGFRCAFIHCDDCVEGICRFATGSPCVRICWCYEYILSLKHNILMSILRILNTDF